MTDNEIIKAFTLCANQGACKDCPLDDLGGVERCMHTLLLNALDLINRLKAENKNCGKTIQNQREQLKACNEKIKEQRAEIDRLKQERDEEHDSCNHYMRMCAKAHVEGAKKFAERVKALLPYDGMSPEGRFKFGRIKSLDIDNILKELGCED